MRLVEQTLAPGASVSAIARQAGIAPAQLFGWRRQAIRDGRVRPLKAEAVPHFAAVEAAAPSVIEIVIGNIIVRADAGVAEEHLRRVIRAVRLA
jgi:transposase